MFQPSTDGRATPRGRPDSLALEPFKARADEDAAFMMRVRTRSTNIIGFSELLTDVNLALSPAKRAEYAGIIRAEGVALDRDVRFFLYGEIS